MEETVKLSVLIPAYNEARTIDEILRLVAAVPIEKEILVWLAPPTVWSTTATACGCCSIPGTAERDAPSERRSKLLAATSS